MTHVVTSQPTPNTQDYAAVVSGVNKDSVNMATENEEEQNRKDNSLKQCCCILTEEDPLFDYWCIRSIANVFVACGSCTETTCEGCCYALCDSNESDQHHNCCRCDSSCCDQGGSGGDECCDCGECDCDCGGCDCDCGGCDCSGL